MKKQYVGGSIFEKKDRKKKGEKRKKEKKEKEKGLKKFPFSLPFHVFPFVVSLIFTFHFHFHFFILKDI